MGGDLIIIASLLLFSLYIFNFPSRGHVVLLCVWCYCDLHNVLCGVQLKCCIIIIIAKQRYGHFEVIGNQTRSDT